MYENKVDTKKLNNAKYTLDNINTLLNKSTLDEEFELLNKKLNNLNFEHGNLFPNYQIYLNKIFSKIMNIKKDILSLENNIDYTLKDIKGIENNIANTIDSNSNVIPIGLGIATTGITAAVGTHIVDNLEKPKKEFPHMEKENKTEDFNFNIDYDEPDDTLDFLEEKKEEPVAPYEAKREITSLEEYYENNDN